MTTAIDIKIKPEGLYAWSEIAPFVGVGRETWRRYVLARTAPQPVRLGTRCTRYRGGDVLAWIKEPATYRAPETEVN